MIATPFIPQSGPRRSQRGQAVLLVVTMVATATALFAYGMVDTTSAALRRDQDTAVVFARAKQALIGWSVQRTPSGMVPNARPGELPCPDMNNDGLEDGSCAAGAIGRVPWKTLGIPEPKDAAGETLWYAIAGPFRIWNMNGTPINSDTKGNVTVYQDSAAVTITAEAVAVIFAPGALLGGQNRNPAATALCPTTGTTIANNLCAANYLETAAGVNNAATNGPFISAQGSDTFNDKIMVITTADLMPVVEKRVARELRALLLAYRANSGCGCYPWADWTIPWTGEGDNDALRGAPSFNPGDPELWGSGTIPPLPGWVLNNQWWRVVYYAVAPSETEYHNAGTLTVNGVAGVHVVLITTGPAVSGDSRPSWDWTNYVDDVANSNSDNLYLTPSSSAYARDRLYTIP